MLSRFPIISVAYVLLAAIAVVAIDLRIVLIPTAVASILLAIAGVVVLRRFTMGTSLPWPASKNEQQGLVVIDGASFPFEGYEQELIIVVRPKRLLELGAGVLLSATVLGVTLLVPIATVQSFQVGMYETEFICIVGLLVLLMSVGWFTERRFLAKSRCTIGSLIGADPGFHLRSLTYQFLDAKRERRGGHGPFWSKGAGNAVVVFYDPDDPDVNAAHNAFFFHSFRLALVPARNRRPNAVPAPD